MRNDRLFLLLAAPLAMSLVGCSEAQVAPGANDGSVALDASTGDAAEPVTCGPAPHVLVNMLVKAASAGEQAPLVGAKFTTTLCPGYEVESGADGRIVGRVSKSVPFTGRFLAKGFVNTLTSELLFTQDAEQEIAIPPNIFAALIPDFGPSKTALFIGASKDGASGDCAKLDNISISVAGHPEARVVYYSADAIPVPTGASVTSTAGRAVILDLPAGEPVTLTGSKPGCEVTFVKTPYTGRARMEPGYITLMPAYVRGDGGAPPPDAGSDAAPEGGPDAAAEGGADGGADAEDAAAD